MGDVCTGTALANLEALAANARMAGVDAAVGDLLAFLDDDNEFEPGHLTAMVAVISEQPPVQAVYCWRQPLGLSDRSIGSACPPADTLVSAVRTAADRECPGDPSPGAPRNGNREELACHQ